MQAYWRLLTTRPGYRNLWLASVVSLMGDWFNTIASMMIVNRYTETDLAISWILIARTIPRFFLGPVAGVVADRLNRKVIMVISDVTRAGIVLSFLLVDRPERVWMIYVFTVMQFVMASFFEPASSAIIPSLVQGQQELLAANVLSSVTWSVMLAFGAALGGVFAGLFGAQVALIADSATFLISAALVLQVKFSKTYLSDEKPSSGWQDMLDGFGYVISRPQVGILTLVKSMSQIGSGDIIIAVFAERYFPYGQEGAVSLGVLFAGAGIGAVLGPLMGNWFINRHPERAVNEIIPGIILIGYIFVPLGWLLVGVSTSLWMATLGIMLRLIGVSIDWTYSSVLIQSVVPDRLLGRVFALDVGLFTLISSTALFLTGFFLDTYGVDARILVLYFSAGSILPILIWGYHLNRIHKENLVYENLT